jgi:D-glycerate 3-kinase
MSHVEFYKTHDDMVQLAKDNPANTMLQGRGQPGTHDMKLGRSILNEIKSQPDGHVINLPVYDKSKFGGQGDRSEETVKVTLPVDVVIFEGWCMGFFPISQDDLRRRYQEAVNVDDSEKQLFFASHSLQSLLHINTLLQEYQEWYQHIDAFVQIKPDNLDNVFTWRLQAEHAMKEKGRDGMSDDEVHAFVAR